MGSKPVTVRRSLQVSSRQLVSEQVSAANRARVNYLVICNLLIGMSLIEDAVVVGYLGLR